MKYAIIAIIALLFVGLAAAKTLPVDIIQPDPTPIEPQPQQQLTVENVAGNPTHNDCNFDDIASRCKLIGSRTKHKLTISNKEHVIRYNKAWVIPRFYIDNKMYLITEMNTEFKIDGETLNFNKRNSKIVLN